jgi:hypothetical protein
MAEEPKPKKSAPKKEGKPEGATAAPAQEGAKPAKKGGPAAEGGPEAHKKAGEETPAAPRASRSRRASGCGCGAHRCGTPGR